MHKAENCHEIETKAEMGNATESAWQNPCSKGTKYGINNKNNKIYNKMGKIILTGDRPTGRLHLGHYVVLPCAAKITYKMLIFFKTFITMGREHFPVGIYINAKAFGLFKKHFKVFKVMT